MLYHRAVADAHCTDAYTAADEIKQTRQVA